MQYASARNGRPLTWPAGLSPAHQTAAPLASLFSWPNEGSYQFANLPRTATDEDEFTMRTYNASTGANGVSVSAWWG
jgi:hypothetical protein